jgi:hypothetical protein
MARSGTRCAVVVRRGSALAALLAAAGSAVPPSGAGAAARSGCGAPISGSVLRVRTGAAPGGDGSTWARAFGDLEGALAAAGARPGAEQIWLAAGRYTPAAPVQGFALPGEVALLGGFGGWETRLEQRAPARRATVLDGGGARRHVLSAVHARAVRIDGVIVEGGRALGALAADASDASNEVRGGGLLAYESEITVCGAVFRDNRALKFGGAVFAEGGRVEVSESEFVANTVLRGDDEVHDSLAEADTDGGAIAVHDAEALRVQDSRFKDNMSGDDGGAVATRRTDVHISHSEFAHNRGIGAVLPSLLPVATDDFITSTGGAVCVENEYAAERGADQGRRLEVLSSRFTDNLAAAAGAVYVLAGAGSTSSFEDVEFRRNGGAGRPDPAAPPGERGVSFGRGGGAVLVVGLRGADRELDAAGRYVHPQHRVQLRRARFEDNAAGSGGALVFIAVDASVEDSSFHRNLARQRGGAIWHQNLVALLDQVLGYEPELGEVQIRRSEFVENRALGSIEALQTANFPQVADPLAQSTGGGAILNDQAGRMEISRSRFHRNLSRGGDGGAVHNATASFSRFPELAPGAAASYGAELRVSESVFDSNRALGSGSGGAIANGGSAASGAVSDQFGADVRSSAAGSNAVVEDCLFEGNRAAGAGGAIANWTGSRLELVRGVLSGNRASAGGAVASFGVAANRASLRAALNEFTDNRARSWGGALAQRDSSGELSGNAFSENLPDDVAAARGEARR